MFDWKNAIGETGFTYSYTIDGGSAVWFSANPGAPNGELVLPLASVPASSVYFTAPGLVWNYCFLQSHEFAVGGLRGSEVPEPATMFLFGSGLLGLAGLRRKLL